jgi:LPXTG-motif cell wall-anchored protein
LKRHFALLAMCCVPLAVWAHGGEDHGDAVAPPTPGDTAPRASARTEDFELLAVLAGGRLTLYLDRNADNAPVAGALLEVESGAFKAVAKEVAPAVYALPADAFAKPGKYPLTISVQAGETADLLTATLDLAAPEPAVEHVHTRDEWAVWGGAGIVLLAGIGLVVLRRRRMKG